MTTVGVLGLGAMGLPIALNTARAGFAVKGFDSSGDRLRAGRSEGLDIASSASELIEWSSHILVVLRDEQQVSAAFTGPRRLESPGSNRTLAVMSTLSPTSVVDLARSVADAGFSVVDAPIISGNEIDARGATLDIAVSGPEPSAALVCEMLSASGTVTSLGAEPGMAQAAKLTCQIMQAAGVVATLEGLRFASLYGLDEEDLVPILQRGSARSWALDNLERVRLVWSTPGDPFDLIYKDLLAVMAEGLPAKLPLPLTSVVAHQFLRPELHQPSRSNR